MVGLHGRYHGNQSRQQPRIQGSESGLPSRLKPEFHARFGIGRFIMALIWYGSITGRYIHNVKYNDFAEPVMDVEYRIALEAANHALSPFI